MTSSLPIPLLPPWDDNVPFPPVSRALDQPNGLLAAGGSLRPRRLLAAYRQGIFPWYAEGEPILWWAPDPRCVIFPQRMYASRRFLRTLRNAPIQVTRNQAFREVVEGCRAPRSYASETWILPETIDAFVRMYELGYATSFECWEGGELVGGTYGVHLGGVFFGESMFSRRSNASRIALWHAAGADDIALIDCQLTNPHLERLGAECISRDRFLHLLSELHASR